MNRKRLLARLERNPNNVDFGDFVEVILGFGFEPKRVTGSHRTFECVGVIEIVDIQPRRGEAKPYQIRQFLRLVEKYNLEIED